MFCYENFYKVATAASVLLAFGVERDADVPIDSSSVDTFISFGESTIKEKKFYISQSFKFFDMTIAKTNLKLF